MLHYLTGSEHKIVHAYKVSGWGCRISRVWNNSSNMHTRYQDGAAGHVRSGLQDITCWELEIVHAYEVLGRGCRISRVRNTRSYMPTRYQDGAAGSHGLGTTDRTCLLGISREPGSHGFETPDRTCLLGVRTALHDLTGSDHKIVHAYKVSRRGCKISRVRNTRSYMHRRYQEGAAGSHG